MDPERFVFRDRHGKRWRQVSRMLLASTLLVIVLAAALFYALWTRPLLRPLPPAEHDLVIQPEDRPVVTARPKAPPPWISQAPTRVEHALHPAPHSVRLGLLDDDRERALASLRIHAAALTHVAPSWFQLVGMPPRLHETPDPEVAALAAAQGLGLMPLLTNLGEDGFEPEAVEELLRATPSQQKEFARHLRDRLVASAARGVIIAWEQVDPSYRDEMVALIGQLRSTLRQSQLELWLSIPVGDDLKLFDLDALAAQVDRFVPMLYYQTGEGDAPGPLAALDWFREWLAALTAHGDPGQWVIGLGAFAYDWADGAPEAISFQDAMARAVSAGVGPIEYAPTDDGPHFSYELNGVDHSVWWLDVTTFWNQQRLIREKQLGGIGIDRLGAEDPLIWRALRCEHTCVPADFDIIPPTAAIGTVGTGDFIEARVETRPGRRAILVDSAGFWGARYLEYPRCALVTRRGDSAPRRVAITFDDGPDPRWTPQILDLLKAAGVPAAFFVIGQKANAQPEIIRRIVAEGHELGNHTFSHIDLSRAGAARVALELNATQRVIERITGYSTLLFRPPYDADRTPHSLAELAPLLTARELGYVPAMASIDPLDWERPSAEEIVARVKRERTAGNVILLHDGGGNRAETLAALPRIIAYLKARGDEIVPLHRLLGVPKEAIMPAIPAQDPLPERLVAGTGLSLLQIIARGAWGFLLVTTVLLFARTLLILALALWRARRERRAPQKGSQAAFTPPVSVILAAYNEEKVIAQTLRALLASAYPAPFEVIVIDDGSTDQTAAIVSGLCATDARLRLLQQPNQGKARALRQGLAQARHEFVVMLDADTQFAPDTLQALLQPLRDPRVGAVSGHLYVANRANLLGRFQGLEYLFAFNLDRRAYDVLEAIPVIPGAASAYRASAIRAAGGIQADTLAEDTDLTLSLHRAGYRIRHTTRARAFTEAPQTFRALLRQRKRWSFGTLQCLWKHRALCCNRQAGWLGLFVIPSIWFFQIFLVALIPLIDAWLVVTLLRGESGPLVYYAAFFMAVDLALALVACHLEGEPLRTALLILPMRFVYRPLLGLAILSAIGRALRGTWMAWGRQERWGLWTAETQLQPGKVNNPTPWPARRHGS